MPNQICSTNDITCEYCRAGHPRPHQYKKWVAQTDYCDVVEEVKIPEENLPF